ncbi:hypothetical protein BC628DRAFT_1495469 [Trametes gibbosa]|nr:hypothetical protein BC628DRAFT_1495469 [Trametes gibbosa]
MADSADIHRPQLPTELLREIVQYYAHAVRWREAQVPMQSYKPRWLDYQPLILASKALRKLALETWFEVFYAQSLDNLLCAWPEFSVWTRELHCVELDTDLESRPMQWNLQAFHRLRKLRIDFDATKSNAMLLMRFDHPRVVVSHIQELEIYDLSWPSPMMLSLVSNAFSGLHTLKLAQDLIWCSLCNICRFATFKDHPPEEIVYEKVVGLPKYYATNLMSLTHLHTVELTVRYGLGGSTSLTHNDNIWMGKCDACMDILFADWVGFKVEWMEKKKLSESPCSLKCVRWRFQHRDAANIIAYTEDDPTSQDDEDDTGDSDDD